MTDHRISRSSRRVYLQALALIPLCLAGCRCDSRGGRRADGSTIVLASTTSTDDTGLFKVLLPAFEQAHPGQSVAVVAVGTGQALALGRAGNADVLLVHSRSEEDRFLAEGYGRERVDVMYNDFLLLGPSPDPARVAVKTDVLEAMRAVSAIEGGFVSRGDGSGTHLKEQELLDAAGLEPASGWRLSIGQGMAETLMMASERQAYTLSDRGTFLAMRDRLELKILFQGDRRLLNPYGAILVSDPRNPKGALALFEWLTSDQAREIIRGFGVERYGEPLFFPAEE